MATNERMDSIKKATGMEGDKQMNINRKTTISEGGKLANTNRQAATIVASSRKIAMITGVFFLITIIASIPAVVLYGPVLNDPAYIVGAGADTRVFWGAFLEVITAIAIIGTAVTLFPILKRQNEGVALGYVAARVLESTVIVVGIVSLLSVVTLRQGFAVAAGADAASLVTVGKTLVAIHDWTFLLGPGLMPGVNGLLLGYLMYRSALVPRAMAMLGLVGGPLLFASAIATLFGLYEQVSVWGGIATLPIFAWELTLAIWLIVKGFNSSAIAKSAKTETYELVSAA